ncbi:MAG TPA: adenylate/guanylate cyclase domain-containing protein [Stellaceae bacterium]|nr:adenylate/guanylate cyclase domain-containing protein [Stellaceae bacterium]
MSIRVKILSLAFTLLVIFGIVVGASAFLVREVATEVGGITRFHEPLIAHIANLDVITDEYELIVLRMMRRIDLTQSDIETRLARLQAIAAQMQADFHDMNALLDQAIIEDDLPVENRLAFARIKGGIGFIERKLDPFVATGDKVARAVAAGRTEEARVLSLDFRNYEETFGPDTAAVRKTVFDLTKAATASVSNKLVAMQYLSFGLFGLAAILGLGAGAAVSADVVRALRRIVEGTRAVEAGELTYSVPVRTNDEIGQLAVAFNRMVVDLRAKERIKDTFGKFVDPRIVAGLIEARPDDVDHAERQVVTVFFSDVAGFTSISERLTAAAMVNLLNHYFRAVTQCIRDKNGIVDKYMGDGVMAFWAAPFSTGDSHASLACLAALAQQEAIAELRKELPNITGLRRDAPNFVVRMGIATGEAVVGTIGSPVSSSFTVIGDTVNLASRLEAVNKIYGTRMIISDETLRLAQREIEARELDVIAVVGKSEPIGIHEILCATGELAPAQAELCDTFAKGLAAYRAREWDEAERLFRQCLALAPGDGPSALYVERIATLRAEPPQADWDGVWRFLNK